MRVSVLPMYQCMYKYRIKAYKTYLNNSLSIFTLLNSLDDEEEKETYVCTSLKFSTLSNLFYFVVCQKFSVVYASSGNR